jgi:2-oxoglutarate dehydrogenase E2 component (dihydrolipoamide succinyltransferase)
MSVEIKIPSVGESVSEVELGEWLKNEGDAVSSDEIIVMLESDKATVELPAPSGGVISKIFKQQGDTAVIGEVIAILEEGAAATPKTESMAHPTGDAKAEGVDTPQESGVPQAADGTNNQPSKAGLTSDATAQAPAESDKRVMPAAAREIAQNGLSASQIQGTGPGGRILKEDAQNAAANKAAAPVAPKTAPAAPSSSEPVVAAEDEEIVRMTPLRRKIAQRLVEAQQTGALLTTFNEIDMSAAMDLRKQHQDAFTKKYGIKLGFMSFFVKAVIDALKEYPAINAEIRGDSIVYKNHYDIGVAIGGGKALVVPVLRRAERMSFAEIELAIAEYAGRVKSGKITPDELIGGTFTITNGGVYGSLLSTPIVNPPQSGILGMHTIQERPIAKNGQVVIAPMMYIALTYDHRIVDGREAVSFLKRVKDCVENPSRMLLEV